MGKEVKKENQQKESITQKEDPKAKADDQKKAEVAEEKIVTIRESEHKKLIEEAAGFKDKYIRLYAEFENTRKRMERERLEFIKYANEGLIVEFLNVLDDLERSLEAARAKHEDYTAFLKGIEMVMAHIYEMFKRNDVKPIEARGKKFDPHCHEVLMQEETDQFDDGIVIGEFQKGYVLGEKIIRTSKVKVAKKKEKK